MRVLIFDTETTGLIENRTVKIDKLPEVIEFYGCVVDLETGEIERELDTLVSPKGPITDEITKITTIDAETVKGAPDFASVAPKIKELIQGSNIIIAHNLSFDIEMVDIEFDRLGDRIEWPGEKICTVEQTVHLKGFRLSLSALHEHLFGEAFAGAHRAKVDVMALVRVCVELYKRDIL